jgi:hypothetical protein
MKPFVSLAVLDKNGQTMDRKASRHTRRIFNFIQTNKFPDCVFELSVTYGKDFVNAGIYPSKQLLLHALRAFLEAR